MHENGFLRGQAEGTMRQIRQNLASKLNALFAQLSIFPLQLQRILPLFLLSVILGSHLNHFSARLAKITIHSSNACIFRFNFKIFFHINID